MIPNVKKTIFGMDISVRLSFHSKDSVMEVDFPVLLWLLKSGDGLISFCNLNWGRLVYTTGGYKEKLTVFSDTNAQYRQRLNYRWRRMGRINNQYCAVNYTCTNQIYRNSSSKHRKTTLHFSPRVLCPI